MATAETAPKRLFGRRLWWLILGRAAVAVVVILAGAVWARGTFAANASDSLQSIKPLILVVGLLTIIYSAAHVLWKNYVIQARFQFFADVLLVTWLVWMTGGVRSPYTALYIVVISVASWFIGHGSALITSIGSAVAFNACSLLMLKGGASPRRIPIRESRPSV